MPDPEVAQPGTQRAALAERPTVIWYGERGVVNALVAALSARDIETGVKRFLREIQWADGGHHSWIDDFVHATLIVEVGLNDFGDPDLIIVCRTGAGDRFVVIIEAKVITYFASALSNAKGMVAGKNSNINRQLMLRYRFTLALAAWDGQAPLIIEPDPLFRAYARPVPQGGLNDPNNRPRRLGQDEILRRILAPQRVHSLPPCHYHLVAMTWDREPFFGQAEVTQEFMPLFLTPAGGDAWESIKGRVGWIGYKAIKERLDPGADFDLALRIMVRSLEPAAAGPRPADRVDTLNIEDNFKHHGTDSPITRLLTRVEDAAKARFGGRAVARNPGSTSVTIGGKVLVKLIPQNPGPNPQLLLGLSEVLSPREWCDPVPNDHRLAGEGGNTQPFFFLRLPELPGEDEALAVADSIFEQLAERMG